ncbi:MAG: hypothetical protein K0Q60_3469 [Microvirga sp.]|jgi:hypothetical protein|nr:hypothetical protein [Microvirga sp.]
MKKGRPGLVTMCATLPAHGCPYGKGLFICLLGGMQQAHKISLEHKFYKKLK